MRFCSVVQIYKCLQPMMMSLSHKGTLNLLDRMNEKFDSLPKSWKTSLAHRVLVRVIYLNVMYYDTVYVHVLQLRIIIKCFWNLCMYIHSYFKICLFLNNIGK